MSDSTITFNNFFELYIWLNTELDQLNIKLNELKYSHVHSHEGHSKISSDSRRNHRNK